MNSAELSRRLYAFQIERKIASKGALAVVVHLSRFARENGLPLQVEQLVTECTGQLHRLGRTSVQRVLKDYGIDTILAEEGGLTPNTYTQPSPIPTPQKYASLHH